MKNKTENLQHYFFAICDTLLVLSVILVIIFKNQFLCYSNIILTIIVAFQMGYSLRNHLDSEITIDKSEITAKDGDSVFVKLFINLMIIVMMFVFLWAYKIIIWNHLTNGLLVKCFLFLFTVIALWIVPCIFGSVCKKIMRK